MSGHALERCHETRTEYYVGAPMLLMVTRLLAGCASSFTPRYVRGDRSPYSIIARCERPTNGLGWRTDLAQAALLENPIPFCARKICVLFNTSRSSRRDTRNVSHKTCHFQSNLFIDRKYAEAGERLESSRVSGATRRAIISSLIAAILLITGCAAAYSPAPLPANHPASPAAPEAPPPPPAQAFRGGERPAGPR